MREQNYQVDLQIAWVRAIYELKLFNFTSVNNTKPN